jgi:hydroxyacylglutathione hydrolase
MALSITAFPGGPVDTNAFLVVDQESGDALVIDAPMGVTDEIVDTAWAANAKIKAIVITHPHWDHIGDAADLKSKTGAPLLAHRDAVGKMAAPSSSMGTLPFTIAPSKPDSVLDEGDVVELGEHCFTVMHLPGHEPSHIALYSEPDRVFLGGDVLFPNGHGRVDIPGSDQDTMNASLARLAVLPLDVVVYPGHGATTTIGAEHWMQRLLARDQRR